MQNVPMPLLLPEIIFWMRLKLALLYRKLRYGCTFCKIELTQGKYTIVDPEDFERLNKLKWYAKRRNRRFYAVHSRKGKNLKMHEAVMGAADGKFVDHINHNGLDNRKANLRFATPQQNFWNRRKQIGTYSSKYKGVSWVKGEKRWRARITCKCRVYHLGRFCNEIEAARAYDKKAKELFGEYAAVNLKEEPARKI